MVDPIKVSTVHIDRSEKDDYKEHRMYHVIYEEEGSNYPGNPPEYYYLVHTDLEVNIRYFSIHTLKRIIENLEYMIERLETFPPTSEKDTVFLHQLYEWSIDVIKKEIRKRGEAV